MTLSNDETRKPDEASASPEAAPEAPETSPTDESEAPAKKPLAKKTTAKKATAKKTTAKKTTAKKSTAKKSTAKKAPAAEAPAEETPVVESPVASAAAEETPVVETPAEEAPAASTAAEETTAAEDTVTDTEAAASPRDEPVAEMAEAKESAKVPAASSSKTEASSEAKEGEEDLDGPAADPAVAAELAKAAASVGPALRKGKRLKVTLVQVGEKDSFVDYGGRSEGNIATSELKNEKDELKHNVGDEISVVVKEAGDNVVFTLGKRRVPANLGKVKEAFDNQIPMEGKIKSTNKGGFEVDLHGVRSFCPFSQIQLGYCDKPEEFVGQKLPFMIVTFERGGRNIVVSRRKLLEEESKAAAGDTLERLELGAVFEGVVRRLQPYGAFIDIGGMDGLVHVSEVSHGRIGNPSEVLSVGDKVSVKVIRLEGEGDKRRISLSMKQLGDDPWLEVPTKFAPGSSVTGKVVRLAEFGAFVELETGVDGLVHISEISTERIQHPGDKLKKGQEIEVRVLSVDPEQRRISLSMLSEEEAEQARANRPSHRPGGGSYGGGGGRGRRDEGPMHHRSETPEAEKKPKQDVTKMPFEDALEALKNKFKGD